LAEQAQRDVEQLRELDRDRAPAPGGEPPAIAQRPEVQWILPTPGRADPAEPPPAVPPTTSSPSTGPTGKSTGGQKALGRDRPSGADAQQEEPGGGKVSPAPEPTETDRLRNQIVVLSSELYRRGAYSDMPLRELLLIAATTLVTPDRELATEALPGLTERERELLAKMQAFFSRLGLKLAETGDPEVLVAEVEALHRHGDYDEFSRNAEGRYAFLAHSGQQAVVYVEVEDFTSELNENGQWVTELSQQLVVISERDGIPVWREDWQAGVDLSRKRRDDFFIVQVVTLPERLSVGRYNLKIRIRDDRSGAEAETAIDFEMVADPRMTGGQ
jgi:hypothetical protein